VVFSDPAAASPGEQKYAVAEVSPLLMINPSSITRIESTNFRVIDRRRAEMRVLTATTVFRSDQRDETDLVLYYNRFEKIDDLDGSIYNAHGDKIRSLDDDGVRDYSAVSEYSLFEDTRAKVVSMYSDVYPYTIEYVYTIEFDGYINWPVWMAQSSNKPVERSEFEVQVSSGDSLRYWCNFDSLKPKVTIERGKLMYRWEAGQLPARTQEEMSENILARTPVVRIAPHAFEIDRQVGDMTSWKSFGAWYHRLSLEKDILPADACKEIDDISASESGTRERIARLYKYMQARTRYVSIQLGIGGWMPFDATYVHERGYGDCKALSNYMVSILARARIKAYPALIANGSYASAFVADFPSNQFNHCIVCVPLDKDSLWLECTDPHSPVGLIGYSNEGRKALVITGEGGQLVRTPESRSWENNQHNVGIVTLDNFGNGKSAISISWGGNQRDEVRGDLVGATPVEKSRWVHEKLRQSEISSLDYRLTGLDPDDATTDLTATCLIQRYANLTGNRLFFTPNLFNQRTYIPRKFRSPLGCSIFVRLP
jgi:transglutaminase-like putative cysteine protease